MRIVSWNIQWGKGADGRVDLARTVEALKAHGAVDVICLQEVTQGFPSMAGGVTDQVAALAAAFPRHEAVFAPGVDVPGENGGRGRFGNLLLSSRPVLQVRRHALPFPADAAVSGMPRSCLEAVIDTGHDSMRVLTTHLEYYSALQRHEQVHALRRLQAEAAGHAGVNVPARRDGKPAFAPRPRPTAAVLCGDFNFEPESAEHALLQATDGIPGGAGWRDAWNLREAGRPHAPTVGLHGADWPDRQYCCDYFWVSECLAARVTAVAVDAVTAASDHQPVVLDLAL